MGAGETEASSASVADNQALAEKWQGVPEVSATSLASSSKTASQCSPKLSAAIQSFQAVRMAEEDGSIRKRLLYPVVVMREPEQVCANAEDCDGYSGSPGEVRFGSEYIIALIPAARTSGLVGQSVSAQLS